jgi:hypothetical protein
MRKGPREARNRRREFEDSAVDTERQERVLGPSTTANTRFADRAVKAASRAQRGRSEAERLDGADANRRMPGDGPRCPASTPQVTTTRDHCSVASATTAVAAGEIADPVRSRGRSRHVPAFERVVTDDPSAGGKDRRPIDVPGNSHSLFQLWRGPKGQCHHVEPRRPDETRGQ